MTRWQKNRQERDGEAGMKLSRNQSITRCNFNEPHRTNIYRIVGERRRHVQHTHSSIHTVHARLMLMFFPRLPTITTIIIKNIDETGMEMVKERSRMVRHEN